MSITCGKRARKAGGGNRYAIKKSWKRGGKVYRDGDKVRQREHLAYLERERQKRGQKKADA